MKRLIAILIPLCLALPGCSVVMAASDAPKVYYHAIGEGTRRDLVIERLGPPNTSEDLAGGGRFDRYEFKSGMGDRALRAVAYAVFDVLSLAITELVTTPIEAVKRAETYRADALFDSDDMLTAMEIRKESGEPVAVVGDARKLRNPNEQFDVAETVTPDVAAGAPASESPATQAAVLGADAPEDTRDSPQPTQSKGESGAQTDCIRECSQTYSLCISNSSASNENRAVAEQVMQACGDSLNACTEHCPDEER